MTRCELLTTLGYMIFLWKESGRPRPTSQWAHLQSGQTVTDFCSFSQEDDVNEHKVLITALRPPCLRPSSRPNLHLATRPWALHMPEPAPKSWWPWNRSMPVDVHMEGKVLGCPEEYGRHQPHVGPGQHLSGPRGREKASTSLTASRVLESNL